MSDSSMGIGGAPHREAPAQEPVEVPAGDDDVLEVLKEVLAALRKEAPGTPLNNHRFDQLGIRAYNVVADAEVRRRLAAVPPPAESGERGWLVEWPSSDGVPTRWWAPKFGWVTDAGSALRFARKVDAEAYIGHEGKWFVVGIIATEHKRLALPSASPSAPQPGGSWFTEDVRRASERQAEFDAERPSARVAAPQPGEPTCPHCNGIGQRQDKRTGKSYPRPRCEAPQPGGAVKVKALEWNPVPWARGAIAAQCSVGRYELSRTFDGLIASLHSAEMHHIGEGGEDHLKALCQADFEHRVNADLSPSSSGWDAGAEAMREQIIEYLSWDEDFLDDHDVAIRTMPIPVPPASEG